MKRQAPMLSILLIMVCSLVVPHLFFSVLSTGSMKTEYFQTGVLLTGRVELGWQLGKQRDAGCIAMEEILSSYWPDFSLGEKPGHRDLAGSLPDSRDIVMRPTEEPPSPSTATEQQCTQRWLGMPHAIAGHQEAKILTRGSRVPNVELDGLPFLHDIP